MDLANPSETRLHLGDFPFREHRGSSMQFAIRNQCVNVYALIALILSFFFLFQIDFIGT